MEKVSIFSTKEQQGDEYFIESGRDIRLFFEEEAKYHPEYLKTHKVSIPMGENPRLNKACHRNKS